MLYNGRLYRLYQNDMDDDDKVVHQLVLPLSKRSEVLEEMHEGTLGGHLGEDKHKLISVRDSIGQGTMMTYGTGVRCVLIVQLPK